ncbi:hypothetical protein D3C79_1062840 [compost metagenome]
MACSCVNFTFVGSASEFVVVAGAADCVLTCVTEVLLLTDIESAAAKPGGKSNASATEVINTVLAV